MTALGLIANGLYRFRSDKWLLASSVALLVYGYVMVSSASLHLGVRMADNSLHYPLRQMLHIVLGLMAAFAVVNIEAETWKVRGQLLFLIGLLLLVIVLIPGVGIKVNGSSRWLSLGGFRIQVSELMKFFAVVYIAGYVTRHQREVRESAFGLLKPLMLFGVACLLLLKEPDFGSSVVILVIAMGVMFLAGARMGQFVFLALLLGTAALLLVYFSPYRLARVTSFIDPWADPLDTGFQLTQALISFGRGAWLGVGLGSGVQKLFYLPEAHTDFLFSVLAEELGLVGVLAVIGLFAVIVWRAFCIGAEAEKLELVFPAYLAYGLGVWFGFQAFVNMGVNMGMLPTKGLTLPLMSYGGGSMIIMCAAIALLFRVQSEIAELRASAPKRKQAWASAS